MRPGRVRLYRSQYAIDLSIETAVFSKFVSSLLISESMSIPRILIESENVKPSEAISGVITVLLPTYMRTVFSILHFKPLKAPKSSKHVFRARRMV